MAALPAGFEATADLLYTGRGSLPWLLDLAPWAAAARGVLREGGHLFLYEGHPLASLWDRDAGELRLRPGASYFNSSATTSEGFPGSVVERETGEDGPRMHERAWRPGEVMAALLAHRFRLIRYCEHPDLFWDQFPEWPQALRDRLPNSYSLLMQAT